jgi:hypothetical protein
VYLLLWIFYDLKSGLLYQRVVIGVLSFFLCMGLHCSACFLLCGLCFMRVVRLLAFGQPLSLSLSLCLAQVFHGISEYFLMRPNTRKNLWQAKINLHSYKRVSAGTLK